MQLPNEPSSLTELRNLQDGGAFWKAAVERCEDVRQNLKYSPPDIPWTPKDRLHRIAFTMARRCLVALHIKQRLIGMTIKMDLGAKTISGGRVLQTAKVLDATPAFEEAKGGSTKIRYVLKIELPNGKIRDMVIRRVDFQGESALVAE